MWGVRCQPRLERERNGTASQCIEAQNCAYLFVIYLLGSLQVSGGANTSAVTSHVSRRFHFIIIIIYFRLGFVWLLLFLMRRLVWISGRGGFSLSDYFIIPVNRNRFNDDELRIYSPKDDQ